MDSGGTGMVSQLYGTACDAEDRTFVGNPSCHRPNTPELPLLLILLRHPTKEMAP